LPDGIKLKPFYDRSEIVGESIATVTKTLAEGAVLVIIVLYLLLRSFRGAMIVLLALPLSLLLTFIVMKYAGLNANLMSLGGLAISVGMIIDATIIQVENVQRHLGHLKDKNHKLGTVFKGVVEVRKPSIFGELIIALTFIPIITMHGMEGKMFSPLAYTVAIALFASMFLSIFVIPVLCFFFLKHGEEKESPIMKAAMRAYLPMLNWAMSRRAAVVAISIALLVIALASVPWLGREFVPIMDEGAFDMDIQLPPGTSLDRSAMIAQLVQKRLMQFEELETVIGKTGQTGIAIEARGVEKTGFIGSMKPRSEWKNAKTREELFGKMREAIEDIPGIAYGFSQPIQCRIDELVAGTKAQIIVKLFGDDSQILKQKAGEIAAVLSGVKGGTDLVTEVVEGQPYVSIRVDRGKIARYGMNVSDVLNVIEIAMGGKPATQIYQESKVFDLVLNFPPSTRSSTQSIGEILIDSKQGYTLPLSQLADITVEEGPVQISRENAQRRMAVELNVQGRDIGSFVVEAQEQMKEKVVLPAGYYIEWGGQFENQKQAMRRLSVITPMVIGLILLLLFFSFKSVRLAILILITLPFALVGGIVILHLTGTYLSVPASVGFIVLFGVAVLNGVVLISYCVQLRASGMAVEESIRAACKSRLRPILMTASITVFSLIPMIMATGPGSEVQKPLAMVVIGGLITSTLATLLVLPTIYSWFERRKSAQETEELEDEILKEN
jgi:cobalt-zinc-cadmium resistance protein CzcA